METFALKYQSDKQRKYREGYHLLNYLELHQVKGAPVDVLTYPVCRDLKAVFKKGYAPGEQYDQYEWPTVRNVHFLQFEMSIPGKRHTDI